MILKKQAGDMLELLKKCKRTGDREELFIPAGCYTTEWQGQVAVVGRLDTPTMEFYFKSRASNSSKVIFIDTLKGRQDISSIKAGSILLLVRDVPLDFLKKIRGLNHLSGVIWFIDDDIPGAGKDKTLPKQYRKKLTHWYHQARPLLQAVCDKIWVSTPYLAGKYGLDDSAILAPVPPVHKNEKALTKCFYHGSASHTLDWDFILEVVAKIQQRNQNIWFEFIGDHALYKRCRDIARVSILHPMPWQDYLIMTRQRAMDIGLVPLIDTEFNRARSHTKFIDICRQNAVGIYSEKARYSDQIKASDAGIVLENNVDEWVLAIEGLASSDRSMMRFNAQKLLNNITENSCAGLDEKLI